MTCDGVNVRRTEAGEPIDATLLRGFARAALNLDATQDQVNDLLIEHVVKGRFHPSVVADSLRPIIDELLDTMTRDDWQMVADELISQARETLGVSEPSHPAEIQRQGVSRPRDGDQV